jgi:hypothetical protein
MKSRIGEKFECRILKAALGKAELQNLVAVTHEFMDDDS